MLQVQDEKLIRTTREKDMILEKFRNRGMRITKQRRLILDIVFEQDCTSCKEIYYQASKRDKNIGIATVYRMVNALTELGVFQTNVPYRLTGRSAQNPINGCRVILKNHHEVDFDAEEWNRVLTYALRQKGYHNVQDIDQLRWCTKSIYLYGKTGQSVSRTNIKQLLRSPDCCFLYSDCCLTDLE